VLYSGILRVDPKTRRARARSLHPPKGTQGPQFTAVLAGKGVLSPEWLERYYLDDGLRGTSDHVPGVEFSTGSLGHGLPVAVGMALAAKPRREEPPVFCLFEATGTAMKARPWRPSCLPPSTS